MTTPGTSIAISGLLALQLVACGEQAEPIYRHSLVPTNFSNTETVKDRDGYYITDVFASVDVETVATELRVTSYNTMYGNYPTLTRIGVYVDGNYLTEINPGAIGENSNEISFASGAKLISFVNGPQSRPISTDDPLGTFIVSIEANAPIAQVGTDHSPRILVYGDSIAVGDGASPVMRDAWVMRVRGSDLVGAEAWGWRSLKEDASSAALLSDLIDSIADWSPEVVWLAIGTNDYGLNRWSAESFGAAYQQLLDGLHDQMPSVDIYCQSPLVRSGERANAAGSTLGDYRAQILSACSTREWSTYIDGLSMLSLQDLSDGVHPSSAGHAKYADYVRAVLDDQLP